MCQENAYPEDIEFLKLWWSKFIVFKDNKIEDSSLSIIDKANQETNLSSLYGFDKKSEAQNYLTSRKTFNIQEIKDREKEEESHKILKRALIICKQSEFNFMDELKNLFSPYKEAIFTQDLNEKFNPKDYDLIYIVLKQTGRFDDNVILFVQQIREKSNSKFLYLI